MAHQLTCKFCQSSFTARNRNQVSCVALKCKSAAAHARQLTYRTNNPDAGKEASRRYRETNGNTPWPAKRTLGLEVEQIKATTPCTDCKVVFPPECMDFDHLPGSTKVNNVGTMVVHGWSREKVMLEIAKCELVCANCHRIRTRKRRNR